MNKEQVSKATSYEDWIDTDDMKSFTEVAGEANWKGVQTDYMRWYDQLKEACGLTELFGEDEDATMERYKLATGVFFAVKEAQQDKLKSGMSPQQIASSPDRKKSLVKGSGYVTDVNTDAAGFLKSVDQYGQLTVQLLVARIRIEQVESAYYRCILFYLNIVQFCLAIVVFGLGSKELEGGQFASVLATSTAGCVAVIASLYGIMGAIGSNESFLRKYLVGGFWLLAVLTTFLYTEIYMLNNEHIKCTPSKSSYGSESSEGCTESKSRHTILVIIALCQLVVVFYGAMHTTNLLDGLNDQTALESKLYLLTYMRTRFYEAKQFMHETIPDVSISRTVELLDDDLHKRGKCSE